jgi:hypothetical protein
VSHARERAPWVLVRELVHRGTMCGSGGGWTACGLPYRYHAYPLTLWCKELPHLQDAPEGEPVNDTLVTCLTCLQYD